MRIGLLADTHGDQALAAHCATFLVAQCGAERLFFLGGGYRDLDLALAEMERDGLPLPAVVRVPSKADAEYADLPRMEIEMLGTLIACLVHDKAELSKDDIANASVIFHGNSAGGALVKIGPRHFVTPGALAAPGAPPGEGTFGLLALGPNALQLVVYGAQDMIERRRDTSRLDKRTIFRAG